MGHPYQSDVFANDSERLKWISYSDHLRCEVSYNLAQIAELFSKMFEISKDARAQMQASQRRNNIYELVDVVIKWIQVFQTMFDETLMLRSPASNTLTPNSVESNFEATASTLYPNIY
jgi:hypothetical protein